MRLTERHIAIANDTHTVLQQLVHFTVKDLRNCSQLVKMQQTVAFSETHFKIFWEFPTPPRLRRFNALA